MAATVENGKVPEKDTALPVCMATHRGIFNCLTGGACASPVEKNAPPVFQT